MCLYVYIQLDMYMQRVYVLLIVETCSSVRFHSYVQYLVLCFLFVLPFCYVLYCIYLYLCLLHLPFLRYVATYCSWIMYIDVPTNHGSSMQMCRHLILWLTRGRAV